MKRCMFITAFVCALCFGGTALADDLEGTITAIDRGKAAFVVQGITFHTDSRTDYDDGLRSIDDLQIGDRVAVDFIFQDGRHLATEIERTTR